MVQSQSVWNPQVVLFCPRPRQPTTNEVGLPVRKSIKRKPELHTTSCLWNAIIKAAPPDYLAKQKPAWLQILAPGDLLPSSFVVAGSRY